MTERPILMSAPMVRALIAGTKTQTRRIVKGDFAFNDDYEIVASPYGMPGDRLWVREAFSGSIAYERHGYPLREWGNKIWYWADGNPRHGDWTRPRPSIHMPRTLSRLTLEITEVRVQRLQDISDADARAEGIFELVPPAKRGEGLTAGALAQAAAATVHGMSRTTRRGFLAGALAAALGFKAGEKPWIVADGRFPRAPTSQEVYGLLWESINGVGSWASNPFVWVLSFRRLEGPRGRS